MSNEKSFTGRIYFYKHNSSGFTVCNMKPESDTSAGGPLEGCPDYIFLAISELMTVDFCDTTQAEIEALKVEREEIRAKLAHDLDAIEGRIKDLQALPAPAQS